MANNARTPMDLERKYNFSSLLGLSKNIKMNEKAITKVANELANMLNTLIINLKDVLENQSEVSLWFFPGTPTTDNKPYIDWSTPEEHYGDIYYDQETGYVYQFLENEWTLKTDANLIQAMALTNVELDTTIDNERKVYFSQPNPPYSSGDWWILEDGTLKICQLGKDDGEYDTEDFVVSSRYVATIATKTGDTITVLKGTVTKISENYVSVEDLATGGKTVINGANITTGTINTDNVTIGNGNVTMDEEGLKLNNGAKIVSEEGMMANFQFSNFDGLTNCGVTHNSQHDIGMEMDIDCLKIYADIPSNFHIVKAYVRLIHRPIYWGYSRYNIDTNTDIQMSTWGYSRDIGLFKSDLQSKIYGQYASEYSEDPANYIEILNAFGVYGWTPSIPSDSSYMVENKNSINIKNYLEPGKLNVLTIKRRSVAPKYTTIIPSSEKEDEDILNSLSNTGELMAVLNVYGFLAIGEELTGEDKAIELVRQKFAIEGDEVTFDHMEGNNYIVKVKDLTGYQTWYIVNGSTWEVEEY